MGVDGSRLARRSNDNGVLRVRPLKIGDASAGIGDLGVDVVDLGTELGDEDEELADLHHGIHSIGAANPGLTIPIVTVGVTVRAVVT